MVKRDNLYIPDSIIKSIEKEEYINEYTSLKNWFNNYYTEHEQKYRRLQTLEKLTDKGSNPHEELIKLYEEAEIRRARIQELEKELDIVEEPSTLDS